VPTPSPEATPQLDAQELLTRVRVLEEQLDDAQTLLETQKSVFEATVARMESNFTLLIAIIGLAALAVGLIGVRLVRELIRQAVQSGLQTMTEESLAKAVDEEVSRLRSEFEPQFTALYEEYRRVVDRAKK